MAIKFGRYKFVNLSRIIMIYYYLGLKIIGYIGAIRVKCIGMLDLCLLNWPVGDFPPRHHPFIYHH